MRRRHWIIIACGLVVLVVAAMALLRPAADNAPVIASADAKKTDSSPPTGSDAPVDVQQEKTYLFEGAGPPEPDPFGPPDLIGQHYPGLLERATAGDTDAMVELGRWLMGCRAALRDPDARQLHERLEQNLAPRRDGRMRGVEDIRRTRDFHERSLLEHVDCVALGAERVGTALGWIERAARAGDHRAMADFARYAFDRHEYETEEDLVQDLDEVIRRRDLARAWIQEALDAGERGALGYLSNDYGTLFPYDRVSAEAYRYAASVDTAFHRPGEEAELSLLWHRGPRLEWRGAHGDRSDLSEADYDAVLRRGREIYEGFGPRPAPPPKG